MAKLTKRSDADQFIDAVNTVLETRRLISSDDFMYIFWRFVTGLNLASLVGLLWVIFL